MSDLSIMIGNIPLRVVDNGNGTFSIASVINAAIPAGANLIGKTGIDQTTDGMTNRVVAKISQTAGENIVTITNLDIALSTLRDALTGETPSTLNDLAGLLTALGTLITGLTDILGEVQASPTANTLLDRLKAITTELEIIADSKTLTSITNLLGALTDAAVVDPATNGSLVALLKGIIQQLQGDGTEGKAAPVSIIGIENEASDTITRPENTTAYTTGDVMSTTVGEVMEFTNMGEAGDIIVILCAGLLGAVNAVPANCAGYRLHLYSSAPTPIADADPFTIPSADRDRYIDYIPIGVPERFGGSIFVREKNINLECKLAGTSLYGILQVIGAETPASATAYTLSLLSAGV